MSSNRRKKIAFKEQNVSLPEEEEEGEKNSSCRFLSFFSSLFFYNIHSLVMYLSIQDVLRHRRYLCFTY